MSNRYGGMRNFASEFTGGLAAGEALGNSMSELDMNSRINKMSRTVQEAGGDIGALDPSQITSGRDMQALGKFQEQYLQTQEGQMKVFDAHNRLAEQQYYMLAGGLDYLDQVKDNPAAWGAGVEQITAKLNLPYNVKYDGERGDFELIYQDRAGEKGTGQRMSRDEMMQLSNDWRNGETFTRAYSKHAMALMQGNIAYKQDQSTWLNCSDADGKEVTLVPQKQPGANGGIDVGFLAMRQGQPVEFISSTQLGERGINMRSVEEALQQQRARISLEREKVGLQRDKMSLSGMAGGAGGYGPGSGFHQGAVRAGFLWDKEQGAYFRGGVDMEGKPFIDRNSPMTAEDEKIMRMRMGEGRMGMTGQPPQAARQAEQERPPAPNIPQREAPQGMNFSDLTPETQVYFRKHNQLPPSNYLRIR